MEKEFQVVVAFGEFEINPERELEFELECNYGGSSDGSSSEIQDYFCKVNSDALPFSTNAKATRFSLVERFDIAFMKFCFSTCTAYLSNQFPPNLKGTFLHACPSNPLAPLHSLCLCSPLLSMLTLIGRDEIFFYRKEFFNMAQSTRVVRLFFHCVKILGILGN